jgi:hypothetical protein
VLSFSFFFQTLCVCEMRCAVAVAGAVLLLGAFGVACALGATGVSPWNGTLADRTFVEAGADPAHSNRAMLSYRVTAGSAITAIQVTACYGHALRFRRNYDAVVDWAAAAEWTATPENPVHGVGLTDVEEGYLVYVGIEADTPPASSIRPPGTNATAIAEFFVTNDLAVLRQKVSCPFEKK